jgi:hypothetical protein
MGALGNQDDQVELGLAIGISNLCSFPAIIKAVAGTGVRQHSGSLSGGFGQSLGSMLGPRGCTQQCLCGDQLIPCCAAPAAAEWRTYGSRVSKTGHAALAGAGHRPVQRLRRRLAVPSRPTRCGRGVPGRAARRDGRRRSAHRRDGALGPHAPRAGRCRASGAHRHGDDQGAHVGLRFAKQLCAKPSDNSLTSGSCDF